MAEVQPAYTYCSIHGYLYSQKRALYKVPL